MPESKILDDMLRSRTVDVPESEIKKNRFSDFMTTLFGYRRKGPNSVTSKPIDFVKVDLGADDRISQAFLSKSFTKNSKMGETLEKYFDSWLNDTTDKQSEIKGRRDRIDQIDYARLNDPYIGAIIDLYADESVPIDSQDTIISVESPDPRITRDIYKLLSAWGVNSKRLRATAKQLASYGDAFWANKISDDKGVERIIPLQQYQVTERLEFSPIKALEMMKRRSGAFDTIVSTNSLIKQMLDSLNDAGDFADIFDTKLFGFVVDNDLVAPPWCITHFRLGDESSQFWPFGESPILGALPCFKQTQSTIALQSLARVMNFPIQIYKVKTSDEMDEGRQFETVNSVREAYDNIGVTPKAGNSEVYTVNTKIWIPDGLLSVENIKPDIDVSTIGDIELYQDRTAVAVGMPKSFYSEGWWSGLQASGKALTQQWKPFARKVHTIQTAILDGLADTIRIHLAITGVHDFRTPFTLSIKYPIDDIDSEIDSSRKSSLEMADAIITTIKNACGMSDEEMLPPDVIRDILARYTFINPTDVMKWTRSLVYNPYFSKSDDESEGEEDEDGFGGDFGGGFDDMDIGGGMEMEDLGGSEPPADSFGGESLGGEVAEESVKMSKKNRDSLRLRERAIMNKYSENKERLYFDILNESGTDTFVRKGEHVQVYNTIPSYSTLLLETLYGDDINSEPRDSVKRSRKGRIQEYIRAKEKESQKDC